MCVCFLAIDRKAMDSDSRGSGENVEEVVGGEAIIKTHCREMYFQ